MRLKLIVSLFLLLNGIFALAQEVEHSAVTQEGAYRIVDTSHPSEESPFLDPLQLSEKILNQSLGNLEALRDALISLIDFEHLSENWGEVSEPYNRKVHFGAWVDDWRDSNCFNTRAKVLIRDSLSQVAYNRSGCTVFSGAWHDSYRGVEYSQASDVQIDHFVPLKNAYLSGAAQWNKQKRCLYANFLGNNFHLLAVSGSENNRKSDKSPKGYMPPNLSYQCQYLAQWLKVKLIWSLTLSVDEKQAVLDLIASNRCSVKDMTYSTSELSEQRQFMSDNLELCR